MEKKMFKCEDCHKEVVENQLIKIMVLSDDKDHEFLCHECFDRQFHIKEEEIYKDIPNWMDSVY